jgi:hypothetical protein
MTRIIIELDSSTGQPGVSVMGPPSQGAAHAPTGASQAAIGGASPPAEVLAQAAAIGALNGGAGPSSISIAGAAAPIASSIAGAGTGSYEVASAGAAPQHLFGTG